MSYYRCEKQIIGDRIYTYWYVEDELINVSWEKI